MTDYNVKFTDTTKSTLLVEQDSEVSSGTDLTLFGRSFLEYGEQLNENLVRLLENFACPESSAQPGTPDLDSANNTLSEPVQGQLWFNTTDKSLYSFDGASWTKLSSGADYAANWGQIADGQAIPVPVSTSGYVFDYSECIWIVGPAGHAGRFDNMICTTDSNAVVNSKYRLLGNYSMTSGIANYLIIGIKGNVNSGRSSYDAIEPPGITPTQTPTVTPTRTPPPTPGVSASPEASPTITPTKTPTPTPTKSPGASATPTKTPAATPNATPTKTPTPTPSRRPDLSVQIVDSARGGNYVDSLSLCDIADYASTRDYGNVGCTTSFGMCGVGECSPEPGTYSSGEGVGSELGITCSGGVAPYTVRFKNFTATSGASAFAASGDCLFIGGSSGFSLPNTGTVYTFTINTNGGSVNGLAIHASCGDGIYTTSGNFTVEVTDAAGAIVTNTFPYAVQRTDSQPVILTGGLVRAMHPEGYTGTARCAYVLSNDGTGRKESSKTGNVNFTWLNSGSAGDYEVMVTGTIGVQTAGSTSGTLNTWLPLSTTRTWAASIPPGGSFSTGTIEYNLEVSIRKIGTTTVLDTASVILNPVVGEQV